MSIKALEIKSKTLHLMKPVTKADYSAKTVISNSAWEYVELWLKRTNADKRALFYWDQARNFFTASECLPIESRPLTAYYCCLNATKALLAIKRTKTIDFDKMSHGITSDKKQWTTRSIKDAEVKFLGSGVLHELSSYLGEAVGKKSYSVYDLLYNIPCIHRSFSITFKCSELFVPIRDVHFIIDTELKKGWAQFQVDERYANGNSLKHLSNRFEKVKYQENNKYLVRLKKRFRWDTNVAMKGRLENLSIYHGKVRKNIYYVFGDTRLWYVKKTIHGNQHILNRNALTLIFAVMHWLSELTRYKPERFNTLMNTRQNWLLHEFIDNALYQFIDEISCEMTGTDIMTSRYRK